MIKHVILWQLKDEIEDKNLIIKNIKTNLESLKGKIDGLLNIQVNINPLNTSNVDLMLECEFRNIDSLKLYSKSKEHNEVANKYVRPYYKSRYCIDYEV